MAKDKQPGHARDLSISHDDLDEVVAIAGQMQAAARDAEHERLTAEALEEIGEATGLSRTDLAKAKQQLERQRLDQQRDQQRLKKVGLGVLVVAGLATVPFVWQTIFPPNRLALDIEAGGLVAKAHTAHMQMRNSEAMAYAKQALKKNPDNPQAWSVLGQVHQVWKEYPQAREAYTKGLATGPFGADAADLHYHFGTLLSLKPDTLGEAVQHFQQALELQPRQLFEKRRGQIHTALGEASEKQGKHAEAVAQYQAALEVFPSAKAPKDHMARLTARVALADKPAPKEAAAIEAGALRARMWNLHAKQQRYKAAVELGLQGVTRFPDDFMLWNELGAAYEKNGQALEAAKAFTTAIRLGGDQRDAAYPHYNMGRLMAAAGKHQEAADYYKKATARWPGNKDYHLLVAKEYEALNRPHEAAAAFQAVLKLDPDSAAAREGLARTKVR